jgi:hypothetical protein
MPPPLKLTYPAFVRPYITPQPEPGQQFPTSNFRGYVPDPGSNNSPHDNEEYATTVFQPLENWQTLGDWWFTPWDDIVIVDPNGPPPPDIPDKLIVSCVKDLPYEQRGDGLVIDFATFAIIGCYRHAEIPGRRQHVKAISELQRRMDKNTQAQKTASKAVNMKHLQKLKAESEMLHKELGRATRLSNIRDMRPVEIAMHVDDEDRFDPAFCIHEVMDGKSMGYAMSYEGLQDEFREDMGEYFDVERDERGFVYQRKRERKSNGEDEVTDLGENENGDRWLENA